MTAVVAEGAGGARRAFVLGGGIAGIVAAFGLRDRGFEVTLIETRRWLGGRAFSSQDPATGWVLDNGPHVMLGCYRAMRTLLRRIGSEHAFQQDGRLRMVSRDARGGVLPLSLSGLPVPLAMPLALMRLPLPFRERMRALRGMVSSLRGAPAEWTLADWFERRGQQGSPDACLWRPLCRAIMNVEPELASAADFLATLREAFSGRASSAAFWLPRQPWNTIVGEPALAALRAEGVDVRLGVRVTGLSLGNGRISAIETYPGESVLLLPRDVVVSALPWFALHGLLPELLPQLEGLASSPIVSAYFETENEAAALVDEGPVVGLIDGDPFHFVLRVPDGDVRRFAMLSGGSRVFDGMAVDEIATVARTQIQRHYPEWAGASSATVRVRKEQHATFIAAPGSRELRLKPGRVPGGLHNLRLCGDWTNTGLPATLEGAARSAEMLVRGE